MLAGASRIDITPPTGVPMGGYLARTQPAEDIHDPLHARALVLDDGQQRVAIVSADLPTVDPAVALDIRQRIEREAGIPPSHTLLALSHTHSGPLVSPSRIVQPAVPYLESLRDKLVAVVRTAASRLKPAQIGAGRAKVYLGVNRRVRGAESWSITGKNPAGYASPFAHILVAAEKTGGPLGIFFTYGAHPVVLGPENLQISGDYAGCAARVVEEDFGDTAVALFGLGFAGDVNANFAKRTFDEVETIGSSLARAVIEAMKTIPLVPDLSLRVRSVRVPLPLAVPPSASEAERVLYEERERLAKLVGHGEEESAINERRLMVEWASDLVCVAGENRAERSADLEIQVFAMGPIALVALSAEPFAEYAKPLETASPFPHTFPIGNANGDIGYIPTAPAFADGGYEVEMAPRVFGALAFRPDVDAILREALAKLLAEMAAS
jgi:hypothetical protein